jgi:Peptidase propeptide and YPEB domain
MTELFAVVMWAVHFVAAHITFHAQSVKLAPVMQKFRKGLVPAALLALGFATFTQAHGMPGPAVAGSAVEERATIATPQRDGISLDDAVRMAEAQYHARVVRTDVQDEDGRKVYVLKLLSEDGRVITVRIDASSGRMR